MRQRRASTPGPLVRDFSVSVRTPVRTFVLRHAARVPPPADAERMADGTPEDPHLCPRRGPELRAAPTHQAGGGQGSHQRCSHHGGLDPHRRGQHWWVLPAGLPLRRSVATHVPRRVDCFWKMCNWEKLLEYSSLDKISGS